MAPAIQFKVCGLTSLADARHADRCGADYLGFILYPSSPRWITLAQYASIAEHLDDRRRVAVSVEPTDDELARMRDAGFGHFQVHFRHDHPLKRVEAWASIVGIQKLWLAPKLPPSADVLPEWLPLSGTFLLDSFHAGFGGSGKTGDWEKFRRHHDAFRDKTWVLAGGLTPANVGEAIAKTGAQMVDVNSGVESALGVKDPEKLAAFAAALRSAPPFPSFRDGFPPSAGAGA